MNISLLSFKEQAHFFACCSEVAYETPPDSTLAFHTLGINSVYLSHDDSEAYVLQDEYDLVVVFRGTECDVDDIKTDINVTLVPFPQCGKVHSGFNNAVNEIWSDVAVAVSAGAARGKRVWFTGHSLGAAMATIAAIRAVKSHLTVSATLFTYGSPRVGNKEFANTVDALTTIEHHRFVNNNDIVTRIPALLYKHTGDVIYMNHWGNIREMTAYQKVKDRFRGFFKGLTAAKIDQISDHSISNYCDNLDRWVSGIEVEQKGL